MSGLPPEDEEFLGGAASRWLLTPTEIAECRRLCAETGVPAAEVARDRRLLEPEDLDALLEWLGGGRGARSVPIAPQAINRRYAILGLLAEGGMGRVYLVADVVRGGAPLALKTLRKDRTLRSSADRFAAEFKTLAGMRHPNVQAVYDYGVIEEGPVVERGGLFFTCERIEGADLMRATEGKDWRELLPLIVQLCRGLQFLHSRGLMHLDVKPENVLVRSGGSELQVKLVDFGLTQSVTAGEGLEVMGTLAYLSPEMIRGEPVDQRADLYGLGVTVYQVLTRALPFPAATPRGVLDAHLEAPIPSVCARVPDLPAALDDLVRGLLAKTPATRVSSAGEAIRRLSQAAGVSYEAETKGTMKGYVSSGAFLGRGQELEWLRSCWDRVRRAEPGPRMVLVSGEPGIGKSRLVREFRIWAQTHGVVVVEGRAEPGSRRPFGLFQEPLDRLVRQVEVWERVGAVPPGSVAAHAAHLRVIVPGLEPRYPGPDPEPLPPEKARLRVLDKASEFVLRAVRGTGLLLVVEDLHWADAESLEFAEFLARKAARWGGEATLLVVATVSHDEGAANVARVLDRLGRTGLAEERRLGPLPRGALAAIVRTMFGHGSEDLLERILASDESGNPEFLHEVLRGWVDEEVLIRRPWGWEVDREGAAERAVPRGMREALAQRLARIGAGERRWLGRLAVWGGWAHEADFWILGILGSSALADLVRRGLLREDATPEGTCWRFSHVQMAEAARVALGAEECRGASLEFLRALETGVGAGRRDEAGEVDRLARLAWEAGDGEAFRRWGAEAARRAERRHAFGEALALYRKLQEVEPGAPQRMAMCEKIGDLHAALGEFGPADACYREALSERAHHGLVASDVPPSTELQIALARLLRKLGQAAQATGGVGDAGTWFDQALREIRSCAEPCPDRAREEARVLTARARFEGETRGDVAAGERLALEAMTVAWGWGAEGAEELHLARLVLGLMRRARGDGMGAREHFSAVEGFWRSRGRRSEAAAAAVLAGEADLDAGNTAEALADCERGLAAAEEAGDRRAAARAWGLAARIHRRAGARDRALECLEHQRAVAEEIGWDRGAATAHVQTARLFLAEAAGGAADPSVPRERGIRHLKLAVARYEAAGAEREAAEARAELEREGARS